MIIIICDDDPRVHEDYSRKVKDLALKYKVKIDLLSYMNGKEMLQAFDRPDFNADVIFLDIYMPYMEGDAVAQELRERGYKNDIVFLTVSTQINHFKKALKYKALDYVIKGETDDKEFERIFLEAGEEYNNRELEYVNLSFAGETRNIAIRDIQYFEYRDRKITVYYGENKAFQFWDSLDRFEKQLELHGFLRTYSAFLVQMAFIDSIKRGELVLKNGKSLFFNKNHTARFKKILDDFYKGHKTLMG